MYFSDKSVAEALLFKQCILLDIYLLLNLYIYIFNYILNLPQC